MLENIKGLSYQTASDMVVEFGERILAEDVYNYITGPISPCVVFKDGTPIDYAPRHSGGDTRECKDILEAEQIYYTFKIGKKALDDKKRTLYSTLHGAIKKAEKRLSQIQDKLFECADMESERIKGELITANIYKISKGDENVALQNYYDPECKDIKITLDKSLTPSQNAQKYYKRYNKLKRTKAHLDEQLKDVQAKLYYLYGIGVFIENGENLEDLKDIEDELKGIAAVREKKKEQKGKKKKEEISSFREYFIEGFRVLCGRNNVQNDRLLKTLSGADIWMHTKAYHSSHVAILSHGTAVPESVIKKAAAICAFYSNGKEKGKVMVDYALKKYVKKPEGAPLGFVTYTNYNTVTVEPKICEKEI